MPPSISWIGNVAEGRGDKTAFIDPVAQSDLWRSCAMPPRASARCWRASASSRKTGSRWFCSIPSTFPILFWGAIRAGIVPVLVNTRLTVDQYRYLFEDSRAKAVFVSTALLPVIAGSRGRSAEPQDRSSSSAAARHRCRGSTRCWPPRTKARRRPEPAPTMSPIGSIRPARPECRRASMHVHSSPMVMAQTAGQRRIGYREDDVDLFRGEAVLLLWPRQRHVLPDVGRRDLGVLSRAADAADRVRDAARLSADDVLRGADALRRDARRSRMQAGKHVEPAADLLFRRRAVAGACRPSLEAAIWPRHRQRRRLDRDGASLSDQSSECRGVRHLRRAGRRLRSPAGRRRRAATSPTTRSASCWCAANRPPPATGISARNRAAPSSASGLAPATNTCGARTASTPTAAAPTTCSRSAASGCRRSRSRMHWSPIRRCSRPRSCRPRTPTA